ncbi:MAG: peptidylprolyl isomerase [Paludibacteraceae bacterium]|nr:peptidylprolyl isomerase [Paludibacteraceae bacterium]
MKRFLLSVAVVLCMGAGAMAQEDKVLMTVNGEPVTASEFLYIYEKNNQETALEQKSMDEYLDLFINFKLKVAEAKAQGIDTTESFRKELAGYRAQATPKYLKDEQALDSMVRLSYNHMQRDRRAAHIAIQCPPTASDSAVDAAKKQLEKARKQLLKVKGQKRAQLFEKLAREISTDPNVQETGGELGWITPFRYVYSLEEAVYGCNVGEISPIFRTAYGFHIVLVEEEKEHEEVHAAHIMKMVPRGNDSLKAVMKEQIDSIHRLVVDGADFAETARQLSDDKGSAARGGDLGWFGLGMMVKEFEDEAFRLKEGEISEPFASNFGWHFIKLYGHRNILPLDSIYPQVQRNVQRDERLKETDKAFIRKSRAEYNLPADMSDEDVLAYTDQHLEEKYPEFASLVREYHDGILLFEVSLREVWDKASKDSVGLEQYFQAHRSEYPWDEPHFKGYVVYCKDKSSMRAMKAIIRSNPDSIDSYINERINVEGQTFVKYNRGLWTKGQNKAVDRLGFKDKKAPQPETEEWPFVFCVGKKLKSPQDYTDERGKVTTDYQDYLEKLWIEELRKKYEVKVDQAVFNELKARSGSGAK